ncbi:MAG: pantoate--beta-alanine ligase [Kiritimatiellae bacterium]|nr:pantoate--beta-alanine ligase [Kiritimatiellia bacterium]
MQLITSPAEMQTYSRRLRMQGRRIGFVPTMGCLHEGHLSLVRRARTDCEVVVVSIFVNPIQFAPGEDFETYPRDVEADLELCRRENVDIVFLPGVVDMYSPDFSTMVEETSLSAGLCGRSRPGHFRGVATVVAKLFNIVQPDVAFFGEKDAQQARVIRRMVRDLNFSVEIVVLPTIREPDGLAMSSRNRRLSPEERQRASAIYPALLFARDRLKAGVRDASFLRGAVKTRLENAGLEVEYVEIVDDQTLEPLAVVNRPAILAVAVRAGATRLIDNIALVPV